MRLRFAAFLERAADVESFAKLTRFSLERRSEVGRLASYYPNFVVRLLNGDHVLVETRELVDADVTAEDARAARWAVEAMGASRTRVIYLRVDEGSFRSHEASLDRFTGLVALMYTVRREHLLRTQKAPTKRSRAEAFAVIEEVREKLRGVTGGDEEIDRFREEPRG